MTRERLNKLYFDWIYEKMIDGHKSYRELLCYLHSVQILNIYSAMNMITMMLWSLHIWMTDLVLFWK